MKSSERIVGLYVVSALASAAYSVYRGKEWSEVATDAVVMGGVLGTAANVSVFLLTNDPPAIASVSKSSADVALPNPMAIFNTARDLGKMSKQAVEFLSYLNEDIYYPFKENGVKFGPIPSNPSMINQDAD